MAETENNSNQSNEVAKEENGTAEVKATDKPTEQATDKQADKSKEPTPELLEKLKKQVEFYFGDVNMQRDKFLIEQTKLDEGWVPMSIMLNFKLLASMSKDIDVILKALEESELIEISDDRKKIRRALDKPLPAYNDEYRKAQEARTIYLKGFPLDSTIATLKTHFESIDTIENIIMRKFKKGKEHLFKGSIFLQFKTLDNAKEFMNQETIKYKETELMKMWSKDYLAMKEKEKEELRLKKLNKQLDNDAKASKKNKSQNKIELPKGCVLQLKNLDKVDREAVKQKFTELEAEVSFVDFKAGDSEGFIRLQKENAAVEFLKKLKENMVTIGESEIECKLIEGEEEESYLSKVVENMTNVRRGKGFHGKRRGNKRRHSPHRDGNHKRVRDCDN
ncbi:la protein homolog [Phymastichus coffea]|uniref:la protein homolog n=1 Tax=Phymastichus coffea TaxID=108790 RepID=UPI00273CB35B|nr:la protein homolog [Phymastichus coffea]